MFGYTKGASEHVLWQAVGKRKDTWLSIGWEQEDESVEKKGIESKRRRRSVLSPKDREWLLKNHGKGDFLQRGTNFENVFGFEEIFGMGLVEPSFPNMLPRPSDEITSLQGWDSLLTHVVTLSGDAWSIATLEPFHAWTQNLEFIVDAVLNNLQCESVTTW